MSPLAVLTVTTTLTGLRQALAGAGRPDTGRAVVAATLRQLACDALVVPAVLHGATQVLDLGRSTRVWNRAQRRAAALRDRGCVAPGCTQPPAHCQLHPRLALGRRRTHRLGQARSSSVHPEVLPHRPERIRH